MARITNNRDAYFKKIRDLLSKKHSEKTQLVFTVFPAFHEGSYSIQLINGERPYLLLKLPSIILDNIGDLGIYSMNDIVMAEKIIKLSAEEFSDLSKALSGNLIVKERKTVVLDGVSFSLTLFGEEPKTLEWMLDERPNEEVSSIVNRLNQIAFNKGKKP